MWHKIPGKVVDFIVTNKSYDDLYDQALDPDLSLDFFKVLAVPDDADEYELLTDDNAYLMITVDQTTYGGYVYFLDSDDDMEQLSDIEIPEVLDDC
jgi:hypothetical protein